MSFHADALRRAVLLLLCVVCLATGALARERTLLHVSFDPTREYFADINAAFSRAWFERTGDTVRVYQSHGGSGKQARSVIDGLQADVLSLALTDDIDEVAARTKMMPARWADRLPGGSVPCTSTVVFLVRKGNPRAIHDWGDLIKPGVSVITPNPKTSGGGRWNYLAAWGYALRQHGSPEQAHQFMANLYQRVPVLDSGARGAATTFIERGMGDVLLAWESEALMAQREVGPDRFEVVMPSVSIRAEPPVALVDAVAARHGTIDLAQAYLDFLFSPAGQEIAARHYCRPIDPSVAARFAAQFRHVELFGVADVAGNWRTARRDHFADGALFDQLYMRGGR